MQTAINEVSWKNHVAGWLIPWGYMIAPKSLATITTISGLVWSALIGLGALVALKTGQPLGDAPVNVTVDCAIHPLCPVKISREREMR